MKWVTNVLLWMFIVSLVTSAAVGADEVVLKSPDSQIVLRVVNREHLEPYPAGKRIYFSVEFMGRAVLLDSPFGLDFKNQPPLARDLEIEAADESVIEDQWTPVWGTSREVKNHCRQAVLKLRESRAPQRQIELVFRAYNDGVAFRYRLPDQPGLKDFSLVSERTEFHFGADHPVWAANYGGFISHQESEFEKTSLRHLEASEIYGVPLLVEAGPSCWVALTEANLTDWAGMYLSGVTGQPYALVTRLSPRLDEPGVLVRSQTPRESPWRTLMIGKTPGSLIESNLIVNLNEANALKDTTWIKPGRSAWDRWWSGDYAPDADFNVGMNTETMKYFTQFASEMGWEYVLVDWTWYGEPEDPDADITTPCAELDMPELLKFASEKGVKVLVWLRWNHAQAQMEEAFPLYEKWGVAGVKVDFMQRDDQEMVNFYERLVKLAAKHRLVVDFHGSYKPTGLRRTYPNLMTREGVLGNEYNKWSTRVTPEHTVTIPFTRMLAGPMDFTPGGFRHVNQESFVAQDSAPFVMGTRARQLAMMVVYESPLQVLCDSPYNYRGQQGLDFLKQVPTVWDETRVPLGKVGEQITVARKSGDDWFIGSMTNSSPRQVRIPLDFLPEGEFEGVIYHDLPESAENPSRVGIRKVRVTSLDFLPVKLVGAGGCAIRLTKVR